MIIIVITCFFIMETKKENEGIFYLHGSDRKIINLSGLAKELKYMDQHIYEHHVNFQRNDFANWVKHSLNEHALSSNIEGYISKTELELQVLRHLLENREKLVMKIQTGKVAKRSVEHKTKGIEPKVVLVKTETKKKVTIKKSKV